MREKTKWLLHLGITQLHSPKCASLNSEWRWKTANALVFADIGVNLEIASVSVLHVPGISQYTGTSSDMAQRLHHQLNQSQLWPVACQCINSSYLRLKSDNQPVLPRVVGLIDVCCCTGGVFFAVCLCFFSASAYTTSWTNRNRGQLRASVSIALFFHSVKKNSCTVYWPQTPYRMAQVAANPCIYFFALFCVIGHCALNCSINQVGHLHLLCSVLWNPNKIPHRFDTSQITPNP